MMTLDDIYQHFRKEEQSMIELFTDQIFKVENEYCPLLTSFLDPRQQYIMQTLVGHNDLVKVQFSGGYDQAERKRALLYPAYYEPTASDFELAVLNINYPIKFADLHHSQVLGTLANAGLKRETLGDMVTDHQTWQVIVEQSLADYYIREVKQIGKVKVHLEETEQVLEPVDDYETSFITVSSLRLDAVISTAYNISRQRTKELINAEIVTVNWQTIDKVNYEVTVPDIISVRGFGRIKLLQKLGLSKKDKIKLEVAVLRKKH